MMNKVEVFQPYGKQGGWNVRAAPAADDPYVYLVMGAPYTMAQAQMAADSLRRDVRNHGAKHVFGGMLIGF